MTTRQVRDIERAGWQWRRRSTHWLQQLHSVSEERWAKTGEIASLLEPDLKDGIGGLRDFDVLRWALATDRDDVRAAFESPLDELTAPAEMLSTVRCELHRVTGRTTNVLLLEDQDGVAEAMGFADADVFMCRVSGLGAGDRLGQWPVLAARRAADDAGPAAHRGRAVRCRSRSRVCASSTTRST